MKARQRVLDLCNAILERGKCYSGVQPRSAVYFGARLGQYKLEMRARPPYGTDYDLLLIMPYDTLQLWSTAIKPSDPAADRIRARLGDKCERAEDI